MNLRNAFESILAKYKKFGKGNVRLTQSELISVVPIDADKQRYIFPILESDPNGNGVLLNINDEFIVTHIGYYVAGQQIYKAGGERDDIEVTRFYTYPFIEISPEFTAIGDAWNGTLNIEVNNINYIDKWGLLKHQIVPRTQYEDYTAGIRPATFPSMEYKTDGVYPVTPMITFSGAKKNKITVDLFENVAPVPNQTWLVKNGDININAQGLVMYFRGFLAQNASNFQ